MAQKAKWIVTFRKRGDYRPVDRVVLEAEGISIAQAIQDARWRLRAMLQPGFSRNWNVLKCEQVIR